MNIIYYLTKKKKKDFVDIIKEMILLALRCRKHLG